MDTSSKRLGKWTFGRVELDESCMELRVDGAVVPVERRPLEVLLYLLRHTGEVATKDELLGEVWPGQEASDAVLSKAVSKLRHAIGDKDQRLIRTDHGYGYRLVAQVRLGPCDVRLPEAAVLEPGTHPPMRPNWSLSMCLGRGRDGEVWRVVHDKTAEQRVLKFATETRSLASLKREIAILRFLDRTLGERSPAVHMLDWNLSESPFYIEFSAQGRSLLLWAADQGALATIPVGQRLRIATEIARALAAAHSVGVLHKDLKPENVLLVEASERARVRLADFGCGEVLDQQRLDALGITRAESQQAPPSTGGTALYLAPELLAGHPATVQSDVFAFGTLLLQLVTGSFSATFAPGWESEVADPILREDIKRLSSADPNRRPSDLNTVADDLESLDQRHQQRQRAEQDAQRLARVERMKVELRRSRAVMTIILAFAATAIFAAGLAWYARDTALTSAQQTEAVTEFLIDNLLADANPWDAGSRDLTLRNALHRAASEIDAQLDSNPHAALRLHRLVGTSLNAYWDYEAALGHVRRVTELSAQVYGHGSNEHVGGLIWERQLMMAIGRSDISCALQERIQTLASQRADIQYAGTFDRRSSEFLCRTVFGEHARAAEDYVSLVQQYRALGAPPTLWAQMLTINRLIGWSQPEQQSAIDLDREFLAASEQEFGAAHFSSSMFRLSLAAHLVSAGGQAEAAALAERARQDLSAWFADQGSTDSSSGRMMALYDAAVYLELGDFERSLAKAKDFATKLPDSDTGIAPFEVARDYLLIQNYRMLEQCEHALALSDKNLSRLEVLPGWYPSSLVLVIQMLLAECHLDLNQRDQALAAYRAFPSEILSQYPPRSPLLAFRHIVSGRMHELDDNRPLAQENFEQALELLPRVGALDEDWWRVRALRSRLNELGEQRQNAR